MDKSKARIQGMFSDIAGYYDRANSVLSLGLHSLWKHKLVSCLKTHKPELVLDLCCGTGDIHFLLKKNNIKSIALDFTFQMLKILKARHSDMKKSNSANHDSVCADGLNLPFKDGTFCSVAVSYGVRNFENLESGLREINRVLKEHGKLFILESGKAPKGITGIMIKFYESKLIPLIGKFFFSNQSAYSYLSQSSEAFASRQDFIDICKRAGFSGGKYSVLFFGASYLYEIDK